MSAREHGTRAKYVWDECRCQACSAANRAYERHNRRQRHFGRVDLHDAGKARDHINVLLGHGIGVRAIAAAAGVKRDTLQNILRGDVTRIRAATGRRIMAVALDARPGGALIDAAPKRALINALVANGWTRKAIARAAGLTSRPDGALQVGRRQVTKRNAEAIAALWREQPHPPAWARRQSPWPARRARELQEQLPCA